MSAYQLWTLTCDDCGELFESIDPISLADAKRYARRQGWTTGKNRHDVDLCSSCSSIAAVQLQEES